MIITKTFGRFSLLQITCRFLGDATGPDEHLSFHLNNYHTRLMIDGFMPHADLLTMKHSYSLDVTLRHRF